MIEKDSVCKYFSVRPPFFRSSMIIIDSEIALHKFAMVARAKSNGNERGACTREY